MKRISPSDCILDRVRDNGNSVTSACKGLRWNPTKEILRKRLLWNHCRASLCLVASLCGCISQSNVIVFFLFNGLNNIQSSNTRLITCNHSGFSEWNGNIEKTWLLMGVDSSVELICNLARWEKHFGTGFEIHTLSTMRSHFSWMTGQSSCSRKRKFRPFYYKLHRQARLWIRDLWLSSIHQGMYMAWTLEYFWPKQFQSIIAVLTFFFL